MEEKSLLQLLDEAAGNSDSDDQLKTEDLHKQIEAQMFAKLQKVQIPTIDQQHEMLVKYLCDIYKIMIQSRQKSPTDEIKSLLETTLTNLTDYTLVHFRIEEQFMEEIHYPELGEHRSIHKSFIDRYLAIRESIKSGDFNRVEELFFVVYQWLFDHINRIDAKLGTYHFIQRAGQPG